MDIPTIDSNDSIYIYYTPGRRYFEKHDNGINEEI